MFGTDEISDNLIRHKLYLILIVVIVGFCALIVRLGYLQIVSTGYYTKRSEDNRIRPVRLIPPRGVVYDRHGTEPLADNETAFDVCVAPSNVAGLENMSERGREAFQRLNFTPEEYDSKLNELRKLKRSRAAVFDPVSIKENVDKDVAAYLAEHNSHIPEIIIRARAKRRYRGSAAHIIGYTALVNENDLENGYDLNDVIGKDGVEAEYEEYLRGDLGWKMVEVDAYGRIIRGLPLLVKAEPGLSITLTLDLALQKEAENLLEGRIGAIVAMDPRNGDVLAMVSKPDFDANTLISNWSEVANSSDRPLWNRATMGEYPPGSTFKIITATAALEEKKIGEYERFYCNGRFKLRNWRRPFKCHKPGGHGSMNMHDGLAESCNVYFYSLADKRGVNVQLMNKYAMMYGLGKKTDIDLPSERQGSVPEIDQYPGDKINMCIGQGALLVTPLQMANVICVMANRGVSYKPRIVHQPENDRPEILTDLRGKVSLRTIDTIRSALADVVKRGYSRQASLPDHPAAGKTGTVQNPHGDDHAWFIGFAPFDRPEIAVAIIVENAGRGSEIAAPMAGQIFKRYFYGDQPELAKSQ
ncbi:penicillin-binding protein 2 [Candidatus Poribacteria bacterium]